MNANTYAKLSNKLNVSAKSLKYYSFYRTPDNAYISFKIPKKNGAFRTIHAPNVRLKFIQSQIYNYLKIFYKPKFFIHGFVDKKNICTNATPHTNQNYVLNVDINNFFESITEKRVRGIFLKQPFSFSFEEAQCFAKLLCYNGILPQGAPTSPLISNLICRKLDSELFNLARKYKCVYTRYADDISISTPKFFAREFLDNSSQLYPPLGDEFMRIILKNGFNLNQVKTRIQGKNQRQMVTGLTVNKKVNIPKKKYKKIRAFIYNIKKYGIESTCVKNNYLFENGEYNADKMYNFLIGNLTYFKQVLGENNLRYRKLVLQFNECYPDRKLRLCQLSNDHTKDIFSIECDKHQGTAFLLANGLIVTCLHNLVSIKEIKDSDPHNEYALEIELKSNMNRMFLVDENGVEVRCVFEVHYYNIEKDILVIKHNSDLLIDRGFKFIRNYSMQKYRQAVFDAFGFPKFNTGNDISHYVCRCSSKRKNFNDYRYVVDQVFVEGSSGGPVFSQDKYIIGYITHGNNSSGETDYESCFALLDFPIS